MKIDLVYLWVDDTDFAWRKKIGKYKNSMEFSLYENYDSDAIDICRFYNNDELRFSLRSVEKFAPWINKIFIITDNQIPEWLNLENDRVKIVNHNEIIPEDKLPLFNSCAIESCIPYIDGLSEYFLYANDDTFFWDKVSEDFFFREGKPIFRFADKISPHKNYKHLYGKTLQYSYNVISKRYKINFPLCFPHHNIDAYRKSFFIECIEEFKDEFTQTLEHRFRQDKDMQRIGIAYYMMAKGEGIFKNIKSNWINEYILRFPLDSQHCSISRFSHYKYKNCRSKLMCLNDCRCTTNRDREQVKEYLLSKFPCKSSFEK